MSLIENYIKKLYWANCFLGVLGYFLATSSRMLDRSGSTKAEKTPNLTKINVGKKHEKQPNSEFLETGKILFDDQGFKKIRICLGCNLAISGPI